MGVVVNVPGATLIRLGLGSSNALVDFGYSIDGVEIEDTEFVEEVKSDRYGGSRGASIDVQQLGLGAFINMTVVEFDPELFIKLQSRMATNATISANPGRVPTPGTLLFANGGLFRTTLIGTLDAAAIAANGAIDLDTLLTPRNYPFTRVVQAIGYNLGSSHAKAKIRLEAYQGVVSSNVVVWNRATD